MHFKRIAGFVFAALAASTAWGQGELARPIGVVEGSNLPVQRIGKDDLLGIQVYDSPEITRTVRVNPEGLIRLPMLKETIRVEGLFPADVEVLIADELKREQLLVDPFVTVTVAEYHSRPISVNGAVKNPTVFQAIGTVNLLDAIAKAGGFSDQAGGELIITRPNGDTGTQSVQRIPVRALIDGTDALLNVKLTGGEQIRVPVVGTVIVAGNVHDSGVFPVQDTGTTTVMTAIAQAKGVGDFAPKKAYIYRNDQQGTRHEIEVDLEGIKKRKTQDVVLQARDILYVPDNTGKKARSDWLDRIAGVGGSAASGALVYRKY